METGKVIVAKNDNEIETLKELYGRALKNGARVELIDEKRLREIEPYARTHMTALYPLDTSVIDPKLILKSLHSDLLSSGKVKLFTGTEMKGVKGSNTAVTSNGTIKFKTFINASGAYSDNVAYLFGVGLNYKLIPFKGIYTLFLTLKILSLEYISQEALTARYMWARQRSLLLEGKIMAYCKARIWKA